MTLVELAMTCLVLGLVLLVTFPVVRAFYDIESSVQHTYNGVDEAIQASEVIARYARVAVEPAPPSASGVPTPPFQVAQAQSVTFTSNTASSIGPTEVSAQVVAAGANCPTTDHSAQCFLMTFTYPSTSPAPTSCPMTGSTGTACNYGGQPNKRVLFLTNVVNGATPVFTYTLQGGTTTNAPSTTCAAGPGNCQLDEITAVSINLQVLLAPGQQSGFDSLAYLLAPTYNASVG